MYLREAGAVNDAQVFDGDIVFRLHVLLVRQNSHALASKLNPLSDRLSRRLIFLTPAFPVPICGRQCVGRG